MALAIKTNVDFNRNELLNARIENRTTNPTTNVLGQLYFLSTSGQRRLYYCIDAGTPAYALTPRLDLDETVSGQWTFSNGGAPFMVSSSTEVANLNAAQCGGYLPKETLSASSIAARDSSNQIMVATTPTNANHATSKAYVDAQVEGQQNKAPADLATTANITLSGEQTIDGTLTSSSRVLVKDQSTASQNGIYDTAAGSWTRSADVNTAAEMANAYVLIEGGTANQNSGWNTDFAATDTLDTDDCNWVKTFEAESVTAGNGVVVSATMLHFAQAAAYTANQLPYATAATTIGFTALNTTSTRKFLRQVSSGAPTFDVLEEADIDGLDPTFNTLSLSSPLTIGNGGTGTTSLSAVGAIPYIAAGPVFAEKSAQLFFDATNNQLGVGTNSPIGNAKATFLDASNEQLILAYDASNYATFQVSSAAKLTITANIVQVADETLYLGDTTTGDGDADSSAFGGPVASDLWSAIRSNTASETVAYNLLVEDGSRNPTVKLWLTDAAQNTGSWGLWQTYSGLGRQPFVLGIGASQMFEINQASGSQDSMLFGDIPATPGNADSSGGPGSSQIFCAVCSTNSSEQVSTNLFVADGTRNSRARFYLEDAASGAGAWGLWLNWGASGSQPFKIGAGSTEWLRITTGGLMGLGVTDPVKQLHVANDLVVEGGSPKFFLEETDQTDKNWRLMAFDAGFYLTRVDDSLVDIWHGFYIADDKTVNVGPQFQVRDSSATGTVVSKVWSDSVNGRFSLLSGGVTKIFFDSTASGSSYINNGGKFGIGTASPATELDVAGDITLHSGVAAFITADSGADSASQFDLNISGPATTSAAIRLHRLTNTTAATSLQVMLGDGSAVANHVLYGKGGASYVCANNGDFGIANAAPAYRLDIVGTAMLGGDSRSATTTKQFRFGCAHYTHTEEPLCVFYSVSNASENDLHIGGGTSIMNAATRILFKTAANQITTTGTNRLMIDDTHITAELDIRADDNRKIKLGTGDDLQLYHDSTNSYINNAHSGDFFFLTAGDLLFGPGSSTSLTLTAAGNAGFGVGSPSARVHIAGGSTTNPALKLASGTLLTTPEAGSLEYASSTLYFTPSGTDRRRVALNFGTTINGDDATTSFAITHNLGTEDVVVSVYDSTTKELVLTEVDITNSNSLAILFTSAPATGENYEVAVIG